jgi:alkylation response protein AidB-like acyl-CoA dehydrogenase
MYSFEPTDEQKMIVEAAKKLAAKEFRSQMRDADEHSEPAPEWAQAGWNLGLLPASMPEEYGGCGEHSALTWTLAAEELAWGDLSATLILTAPNLVAIPVLKYGTQEQKEKLLLRSVRNPTRRVRRLLWSHVSISILLRLRQRRIKRMADTF